MEAAAQDSATDPVMATDTAVFAGGCVWCMEPPYDEVDGVVGTISGYAGGHVEDPTYKQVTAGGTGHRGVVTVPYDGSSIGYPELLTTSRS